MNKEEKGQMAARLHSIVIMSRDLMDDDQKDVVLEDLARYLLITNERLDRIEELIGYVEHDIKIDI